MARTAVIAGTATATANAVSNRSANKQAAAQQQQAAMQQAAYEQGAADAAAAAAAAPPPPPPAAPAAAETDVIAQLTKLGELKAAGVLTDEEFAAAKAKLLG
jgi:hypothetical protein